MKRRFMILGIGIMAIIASCSRNQAPVTGTEKLSNKVVVEWNEIAFKAFGGPGYQHVLMASRIYAMTHLAMHDAVNAVQSKYARYAFNGNNSNANPVAAAASAAHTVLLHELPAKKPYLDSALQMTLAAIPDSEEKVKGIEVGKDAAHAIIAVRANDGSATEPAVAVPPSQTAGVYQAVPPFDFVFAPGWVSVKPFSLQAKDQFRPAPHPALTSDTYAAAFNEVKEVGHKNSAVRTPDQSAYSKFWYEFSEIGWNRVARTVVQNKNLDLYEAARLFALLNMAIADAYTAGWDAKFHYNFWRPYTAIRNAVADGNAATGADANWEPAEPTPPVQDYPSTHSALGNAGAMVLARLLGDQASFTMTSFTAVPAGSQRSFTSFSQAAYENADSRVRAGIHFRFSCEAGQALGTKIGNWTVDNHLRMIN
jgi:hypothetical protein